MSGPEMSSQCRELTGSDVAAAVLQRNAIPAMMSVAASVIMPVHITLSLACVEQNSTIRRVNYWNIIADKLNSLNEAQL